MNRVVIQPPVRGDQLLTQDNRLYCQARVRDWSGGHDIVIPNIANIVIVRGYAFSARRLHQTLSAATR